MSSSAASRCHRLLEAVRSSATASNKLPCFPLQSHHVTTNLTGNNGGVPTPRDFHQRLCHMIRNAKYRVHLASLYVGTGSGGEEEAEFLKALASVDANVRVSILLDENRATRRVRDKQGNTTTSADAIQECLQEQQTVSESGLFLFPALPEPRRSLLPSPLNEIAGVFHMKAYIVDDELILSGANLSQEYFTDRQDRYMIFTNGGGGLVEFYVKLIGILCQYGYRYPSAKSKRRLTKGELKRQLELLMNESGVCNKGTADTNNTAASDDIIAYAVPTFQTPQGFFPSELDFAMDAHVTRKLLLAAHEMDASTSVQLASAYLNPTPRLASTLQRFDHLQLLTAGPKSHGFAPKPNQKRRGDWVPSIFSALYAELEERLPYAKFLYYEREGWTFHAKGLWLSVGGIDETNDDARIVAAIVGSGNFGARSEAMDVESNTVLLFPRQDSELQSNLKWEWHSLCKYAHEGHAVEFPETSWRVKAALPIIRDLF